MNQRITKLVRQALKDSVSIRVESVIAGSIDGHGIIEIQNSFAEKFAELIVEECADVVRYYYIRGGEPITPQHITRHFGVEE
jgi:hypothetical protein